MSGSRTASASVAEVMLRHPDTLASSAALEEVVQALGRRHVHLVLLTDGRRLVGTLEPADLEAGDADTASALDLAVVRGRTVGPTEPAEPTRRRMLAEGRRRLAVVDDDGDLLGLLCLKRHGGGFCSDDDVRGRRSGVPKQR